MKTAALLVAAIVIIAAFLGLRLVGLSPGAYVTDFRDSAGSVMRIIINPGTPPPPWLHFPPGSRVDNHGIAGPPGKPATFGTYDLTVPLPLDALKSFFITSLTAEGFTVTDTALGPDGNGNAAGFVAEIDGTRRATDDEVRIAIRRMHVNQDLRMVVQLLWRKIPKPQ
jgi:hypothetical protein